jgi:hypothetical protein
VQSKESLLQPSKYLIRSLETQMRQSVVAKKTSSSMVNYGFTILIVIELAVNIYSQRTSLVII